MKKISKTEIEGAWLIEANRHSDQRGWFQELFKFSTIRETTGFEFKPLQINISHSSRGVIRGIHYSIAPEGQAKYVTVMDGEIDDFIIDVRPHSPTFGNWHRIRLNSELGNSVLLGPDLAHAFQVVSKQATVCYAVSAEFNLSAEKAINPFCEQLNISWDKTFPAIVSPKDKLAPNLSEQLSLGLLPG